MHLDFLLRFHPHRHEVEFQLENTRRRILSPYRIDAVLFTLLALFMASGWHRVYNTGHPQEIPYMLIAGIFYTCCACLYFPRAAEGSLLELVQVKLRLTLQLLCYCLATVLFSRHIGLDNMDLCSPFIKEYSSFEALLIYLFWMAGYPTIASFPLAYTCLVQPIAFLSLHRPSRLQCRMRDLCPLTDHMYKVYASFMGSVVRYILPLGQQYMETQAEHSDCLRMMFFWKFFTLIFLAVFITHFFECRVRRRYVLESPRRMKLLEDLDTMRISGGQFAIQIMISMSITWTITMLFI
jgi:hypothetical protein